MSVKLSLSKQQLEGWYLLLQDGMERNPPTHVADQLLDRLVDKLAEKIRNKIRKLVHNNRSELKMTLSEEEAMAFYCWYQNVVADMKPQYPYEVIVCDVIFQDIDRECA